MGLFKDSLRTWFYGSGAKAITNTSNVCLLDASGNPIGCDTIQRVSAFVLNPNDFVDMGLPSGRLWAKRNLGALKETDNGYYFSWGNLNGHSEGSGYNFNATTYNATSAAAISAELTVEQDAARANKGKAWRMPSNYDFSELFKTSNIDFVDASGNIISGDNKITTYNGKSGLLIRSKANSNTLFFPLAGSYEGTSLIGDRGYYWARNILENNQAYNLFFSSSTVGPKYGRIRYYGLSIRPVI